MSTSQIPSRIEPFKLVANQETLHGVLVLDQLERLAEQAGPQTGVCEVTLVFAINAQGRREMRGSLVAELELACRRCLESIAHSVESHFLLGMISEESLASELPASHEPLLVENEWIDLHAVLEDELILSLPQVIYHDDSQCVERANALVEQANARSGVASLEPAQRDNPFAVLDTLRGKVSQGDRSDSQEPDDDDGISH